MKCEQATRFTTEDELRWLSTIGRTHPTLRSDVRANPKATTVALLRGYLSAAALRADWGRIDRDAAITRAKQLLEEVEA